MNERSLRVLEWPKVKQQLAEQASFSLGKERVLELKPLTKLAEVKAELGLTTEALALLWKQGEPPMGGANDVSSVIKRSRVGGVLDPSQLLSLRDMLYCTRQLKKYMVKGEEKLQELATSLSPLPELEREIERCIDNDGQIKDGASKTLSQIRQRMNTLSNRVRDKLNGIIQGTQYQKMLQQAIVTIRNGRYVVPVKQEYRARFNGIVHDQSGSGATVFMEPSVVVELNNQLRIAEKEEEEEIQRILRELSALVQADLESISYSLDTLAEVDFVFARAKYSRQIRGTTPKVNDEGIIDIKRARHPLLTGDVVPIDIWVGKDFRQLVITGPNTGGKTVTLKTVGLLSLMAQAGLHIPAQEGSQVSIFTGIYADIGDEQSIEQSLSTFSSHLTHIVGILKQADRHSLVLLDELGAGTDPAEGAALATGILNYLLQRQSVTVATTHYSELKNYAYDNDQVENASVEFDEQTLSPTYRLAIGIPGRSNAFYIARRLGLQEDILVFAQQLLGEDRVHADDIITQMETDRRKAEQLKKEAEEYKEKFERLKAEYQSRLADLSERRQEILAEATEQANDLVRRTKQEMDKLVGELRKSGLAELEQSVKEKREVLTKHQQQLDTKTPKQEGQGPENLKPGERVRIKSLRQEGYILEKPNAQGDVSVQAGIMKITVKLSDLQRLAPKPEVKVKSQAVTNVGKGKGATIRSELDLRGLTIDEALPQVDKYLDDAFLASLSKVLIIHGKGTGALRQAIAEQLKTHPHVKNYRLGDPNEGGSGVTSVEINVTGS